MNTFCRVMIVAAVVSAVAGCSREEIGAFVSGGKEKAAQIKAADVSTKTVEDQPKSNFAPMPVFDRSSPDRALKSWWKFMDWRDTESYRLCTKRRDERDSSDISIAFKKAVNELTQDDLLAFLTKDKVECSQRKVRREIAEVKVESETRAVIYAKLYNDDDVPAGVEPDSTSKKRREQGNPYKFLMEKADSGWKISQIYDSLGYEVKGADWKPVAVKRPEQYPAYIAGVQ